MIRAILFDLDGVLVDADMLHFDALNLALSEYGQPVISWQEHLAIYKGLPTEKKLDIMAERLGLDIKLKNKISSRKQELTLQAADCLIEPDHKKIDMLKKIKNHYQIAVCSNAKKEAINALLTASKIKEYFDIIISCEEVLNPKPEPDIYLKAMDMLALTPEQCLIVEDSTVGQKAAKSSGAHLCSVKEPKELNYYKLKAAIDEADTIKVVIPAAGEGKRFLEAGYIYPKPLITVNQEPMINLVLSNFKNIGQAIVLLQDEHIREFDLDRYFSKSNPDLTIRSVVGITEGAACTVLQVKSQINNRSELIIANSDQYLDYDLNIFINDMRQKNADGGILTFYAEHPKWSYAKTDSNGLVQYVAEKEVISNQATVGIYYFKRGTDFVKSAKQMIAEDKKVKGEFYVCPVFNKLIENGGRVYTHEIRPEQMHGLGTPEDLIGYTNKVSKKEEISDLAQASLLN